MRWICYTIETTEEAEDTVGAILEENGIDAIEIEDLRPVDDPVQGNYAELQPELAADDGTSRIRFYLKDEGDHSTLIERIRMALERARQWLDMGSLRIRQDITADEDWVNNWKQFFHPFRVDDILFVPAWEDTPDDASCQMTIRVDPGIAFGTGRHESTQLVIRQMEHYLKQGDAFLDIGFGSGILCVTALKLGAARVAGTDVDPFCLTAIDSNMKANGLKYDKTAFHIGDITSDAALQQQLGTACYDVVAANILADILIPMAPVLKERLKPGGFLITSGIIDFRMDDVQAALAASGLDIVDRKLLGEWGSITARRM